MTDNAPLLEMRGVSKRFAGVRALHDVSLSVGRGEVVALIGENGAGKSTLMKILGGVHQPDDGTIEINGQAVTIQSVSDANEAGVAFIHQELNVLDNIDVAGNVFLGREPTKGGLLRLLDRARMERETAATSAASGTEYLAAHIFVHAVSRAAANGGDRQGLVFAGPASSSWMSRLPPSRLRRRKSCWK